MNQTIRTFALGTVSAAALLLASLPASASDGVGARIATGVGRVIAQQGNHALVLIREELKDNLLQTLKPLLPDEQNPAPSDTTVAVNRQ
ncbi:MAG TPA: hypothetical protein VGE57_14125 [Solimonas sp.]